MACPIYLHDPQKCFLELLCQLRLLIGPMSSDWDHHSLCGLQAVVEGLSRLCGSTKVLKSSWGYFYNGNEGGDAVLGCYCCGIMVAATRAEVFFILFP